MKRLTPCVVALLLVVSCQWFAEKNPVTGEVTPGVIDQIAEGANAAGTIVPIVGAVGTLFGIAATIGVWFKDKENKRNLAGAVQLIDKIKPQVADLANDEALEKLIVKATDGTKFGKALKKMHSVLKKI